MPEERKPGIGAALRDRYLDVVASIYLYNEHRGYTSLDRVLQAVRARCSDDDAFLAAVVKHRADEHKHYLMFRHWFEHIGHMPFAVDRTYGHIDHFIHHTFGCTIDDLDTAEVIANPRSMEKLFRVISLTEQRGLRQVEILLGNRFIQSDPLMAQIFRIIHRDEPSHFQPYMRWLEDHHRPTALRRERIIDWWIHKLLLLVKLPALFLDTARPRLTQWPDAADSIVA